jgi:hypothetical protein
LDKTKKPFHATKVEILEILVISWGTIDRGTFDRRFFMFRLGTLNRGPYHLMIFVFFGLSTFNRGPFDHRFLFIKLRGTFDRGPFGRRFFFMKTGATFHRGDQMSAAKRTRGFIKKNLRPNDQRSYPSVLVKKKIVEQLLRVQTCPTIFIKKNQRANVSLRFQEKKSDALIGRV